MCCCVLVPDSDILTELHLPRNQFGAEVRITQLAATVPGYYHSRPAKQLHVLAIGSDGELYGWGQNRWHVHRL